MAADTSGDATASLGEILDLDLLQDLVFLEDEDDSDFFAETVDIFRQDSPTRFERMAQAIEERDAKTLGALAHALKSSAGNLGARDLARDCESLERQCAEGFPATAPELLAACRLHYTRAVEALEALVHEVKAGRFPASRA